MIINVIKDQSHKDYRDFTLVGVIANAVLNIPVGDSVVIECVIDIDGDQPTWANIRVCINRISNEHDRVYRTKIINDKLLVRAVK